MPVGNELKKLIAEAVKQKAATAERHAARQAAAEAEDAAETALRAAYMRVQEEARKGYSNNAYPPRRLLLIDGKAFMLDLAGSVQGEVIRTLEIET